MLREESRYEDTRMETRTLEDYCEFAFGVQFLRRPHGAMPEYVVSAIDSLLQRLPEHGLAHANEQAFPLKAFKEKLSRAMNENMQPFVRGMPDNWINALSTIMEPVVRNVGSEGRTIVLTRLNQNAASARLRSFREGNLTAEQDAIKAEAIRCMEVGAYRAAMVMGWNLVYDVLRRWIFDKHLAEFNAVLTAKIQRKNKPYSAIKEYSEFFAVQERDALDWSLQGNLFNDKVHRALVERLDRRNDHAHANFRHPDATQVMGYINELLAIIEDRPFF